MSDDQDWTKTLQAAFPAEFNRIIQTVHLHPASNQGDLLRLFLDLATHIPVANGHDSNNSKKRKLDDDHQTALSISKAGTIADPVICYECKDVSFQVPARKKLRLQLVDDSSDRMRKEIRLQNQQTSETEYALSVESVDQVFCLPVPEKQQRQWNFCIFPKSDATLPDGSVADQIVFTINETKPVPGAITPESVVGDDTVDVITQSALNQRLIPFGRRVIMPNPSQFASSIPQPHRKGEKAYHVKAHRGSKEGYLFFLENGIVFGFKKPLAFFPFSSIVSVSYTSVLQRTFNLNIMVASDTEASEEKEVEFSMIDQADFADIDEYVKRHELNDASLATERRAKVFNVNKKKDASADAENGEDGEQETGHQKTEQELQDEEDEEEEDYEASGGESDGEGEESDEDEGEEGYEEGDAEEMDEGDEVHEDDDGED